MRTCPTFWLGRDTVLVDLMLLDCLCEPLPLLLVLLTCVERFIFCIIHRWCWWITEFHFAVLISYDYVL